MSGHLTLNLGIIDVDTQAGKAVLDIRYPVKYTQGEILLKIHEKLQGTGIDVKVLHGQKPLYVPKDHFLVKTLISVYKDQTGAEFAEPLSIEAGPMPGPLISVLPLEPYFPAALSWHIRRMNILR